MTEMTSIDSMDSDDFAAFLNRVPPTGRRDDRSLALSSRIQQRTPKVYSLEELGDVEIAKRIENRRGSMHGSLNPDQALVNIENL